MLRIRRGERLHHPAQRRMVPGSPNAIAIVNSRFRATSISPIIATFPSSACPNCHFIFICVDKSWYPSLVPTNPQLELRVNPQSAPTASELWLALPRQQRPPSQPPIATAPSSPRRPHPGAEPAAHSTSAATDHRLIPGDLHIHQHHRMMRIGHKLLRHRIAPIKVRS